MSGTPKLINPGQAPILWSTIEEAFRNINQNFNDLYATIQSDGSTQVVNFAQLYSDVSPAVTEIYDLGAPTRRWKDLYLGGSSLYLGDAIITSTGSAVNLPAGSTIAGSVLDNEYFKSIQVTGQSTIFAEPGGESSLTVSAGGGIGLATNSSTDTLTISNTGVIGISTGSGLSTSSATGSITLTNTGVLSVSGGTGVSVNTSTGAVTITNTGVTRLEAGTGILLDTNTGTITITNGSPASTIRCFQYISVPTQLQVQADTNADTLNLVAGDNIMITTDPDTDTITVAFDNRIDIIGSVFADDSSILVDGVAGVLRGTLIGNVTGNVTGSAGSATVAGTVDITNTNGLTTVYYPTFTENRTAGQILRGDVDLSYRTDSNTLTAVNFAGNLTGTVTGNIFTTLIDSADSSAITVTPATIFSSDVTVENDLNVTQRLTVSGSRIINLDELKSIVAASSSFADFQSRVAAL